MADTPSACVRRRGPRRSENALATRPSPPVVTHPHRGRHAARRLNRAAGMIAASVLIDSAMEHYRGNFHNKAMWTPLVTSSLSIAVSLHGLSDRRHGAHPVRDLVYARRGHCRERSAPASTSTTSPRRSAV